MTLFGTGSFAAPTSFPAWATDAGVSPTTAETWAGIQAIRARYYKYYSGLIFDEKEARVGQTDEPKDKYPVGLNLVKLLTHVVAGSLFGEHDESPLTWSTPQEASTSKGDQLAAKLANEIMLKSDVAVPLYQVALDREIYGAGVIRLTPNRKKQTILWSHVPLHTFYPIFDPEIQGRLLAAYVVTPMTTDQAEMKYGLRNLEVTNGVVLRVEKWTETTYSNVVGGREISEYSGQNPWQVIPYVFAPRILTNDPFGDALTEEIIRPQDEANRVIRDIGEAVSYNTHPTRWGRNIEGFGGDTFELGPNVLWNLGKSIGEEAPPEVGLLEMRNPIPESVMKYLDFVINVALQMADVPGVAVGMDNSPGQTSGITLEQRMSNLMRSVRRSRTFFSRSLREAMRISGIMLAQKGFPSVPSTGVQALIEMNLQPTFANLMPRDQAAIVDEVQKGMSTPVPTISLETAVKKLGYGPEETDKIMSMLTDPVFAELFKALKTPPPPEVDGRVAAPEPE